MKQFCGWVVFCFCFLLILFKIDSTREIDCIRKEWERERAENKARIEQFEKEVRIMQTDLYLHLNGYEGEFEE